MKMKKVGALLLASTMVSALLTGCFGKPVAVSLGNGEEDFTEEAPLDEEKEAEESTYVPSEGAVKTGLSLVTSVSGSSDVSEDSEGAAQTDITMVAVLVDEEGVITDCVIDSVQSVINFDENGAISTDLETEFVSKNELGDAYGMKVASSIGKEWNEQVAALADYAVGKTVEELKTTAIDETGMAADVDLVSSATLYLGGFISGIEDAVNNAAHLGAQAGDTLVLNSSTNISGSSNASEEAAGTAQSYTTVAVSSMREDTISSCYIDAVQTTVSFDNTGMITSDITAAQPSKNELGNDYGMKIASSIGKEWFEEVAAFCEYVTGKTLDEISDIAVNEAQIPEDADLAASVTISIGEFQNLLCNK